MAPIRKKIHINVDLGEGYGNFKCGPEYFYLYFTSVRDTC